MSETLHDFTVMPLIPLNFSINLFVYVLYCTYINIIMSVKNAKMKVSVHTP